jgi:gas vesicle protein
MICIVGGFWREGVNVRQKNALSNFFLGLGLGFVVGVLFAPKSGAETRALVKNKAEEGSEYLKQRGMDIRESASEWVGATLPGESIPPPKH